MKLGMKFVLALSAVIAGAGFSAAMAADAPAKAAPAKPDAGKGQTIATQVCAACHGADGNSSITANPKLAGQIPEYTVKQLINFKPAAGKKAERENAVMAGMVATLSPDDMKNIAAYYASQKPKEGAARNKDLVTLGQKIWRGGIAEKGVAACASCHGANGAGVPSQYPRMAGQHAEYTEVQMKAWRAETRGNDPVKMMRTIAAKLSDKEILAVSDYIAGLR